MWPFDKRRQSSRRKLLDKVVSFGKVRINFAQMELVRAGREVHLTATEFRLLAFLIQNPERVLSREELIGTVWGSKQYSSTRTLDMYISKIRRKMESSPANPVHVRTVHCVGYMFVP